MTMKQVVNHLRTQVDAASGTYLGTALVVRGDMVRTQRHDNLVTVEVIPLPSDDVSEYIGGWEDLFKVLIRAEYPATWKETDKHLDLAEEIKQVVRDNWSFEDAGQGAALKRRRWGYGFDAAGEQTLNTVEIVVEYQAPGPSATA